MRWILQHLVELTEEALSYKTFYIRNQDLTKLSGGLDK